MILLKTCVKLRVINLQWQQGEVQYRLVVTAIMMFMRRHCDSVEHLCKAHRVIN